jgi:RIO kinase 2
LYPRFKSTLKEKEDGTEGEEFRLDVVVAASGFKRRDMQMLEEVCVQRGCGISYN